MGINNQEIMRLLKAFALCRKLSKALQKSHYFFVVGTQRRHKFNDILPVFSLLRPDIVIEFLRKCLNIFNAHLQLSMNLGAVGV